MRASVVFIAACGCAGSASHGPAPTPPPQPIAIDAIPEPAIAPPADAAIDAAPHALAGDSCTAPQACGPGYACTSQWTGGYCTAACDADRACSDGSTCVATPHLGALCTHACRSDADCRVGDGYLCDATWHACLLPNTAAILPRRCPPPQDTRDPAFGASRALPLVAGATVSRDPALAVVGGELVATATGVDDTGESPALVAATAKTSASAWVRASGERRALVVGALQPASVTGVEGDDCAGDASCPARPRLAIGAKPHVAYLAYSGDAIGTRVRTAGAAADGNDAGFGPAVTALAGARGDLALGADNRVHVVAMRGGTGGAYGAAQHAIEYTVSIDGARTFARAVTVSARDELIPAFFASPVLALDDRRGWIYVAYVRGTTDAIWDISIAASKDKGATWTRTTIGDRCSLHALPALAVDPTTGALHVAYYDTRADVARFAHAVCTPGAATCTDRGAISDAPFAAFDTGRLDARWVGDQTALAIDDAHRAIYAAWTQPISVDGHVVARALVATGKL